MPAMWVHIAGEAPGSICGPDEGGHWTAVLEQIVQPQDVAASSLRHEEEPFR